MGDSGDKSRLGRVQFLEFSDIFQEDHITHTLCLTSVTIRHMDRDIFSLEIAFFIICIDFQGLLLLVRLYQFTYQPA